MKSQFLLIAIAVLCVAGCGNSANNGDSSAPNASKAPAGSASSDVSGSQPDAGATKGTLNAKVTETDLALPFYPGASLISHSDIKLDMETSVTFSVGLESGDAKDKVYDFYAAKVTKNKVPASMQAEKSLLAWDSADAVHHQVMLSVRDGKTFISLNTVRDKK